MAGFDSGVIDWESVIEDAEGAGAFLDGRDGAENDELIVVEASASIVINEDMLGRSKNAALAAPDFI